ncbi:MAG TPA: hypothetical protein VJA23_03350 [Candidatus Nanoarchaeia archaeon]|nr:hypothetical protein [Candidatus Nanoarchaeia archaeon]
MQDLDKIVQFLKFIGPTLPAKVAKNIKTDVLLASAMLSDLAAQKKVKLSSLKIGGSPLYYLPGQEEQLYNFASGNLNPKDLTTLEKLKEKKVLREADLELLEKVGLRNLKDFAVPLNVKVEDKSELFWKWHLSKAEEVNQVIAEILAGNQGVEMVPETALKPTTEPEIVLIKTTEPTPLPEIKLELKPEIFVEKRIELTKENKIEQQQTLMEELPAEKVKRKRREIADEFTPQLRKYFEELRVLINSEEVIRKNSELNFLLKVPSSVGYITYFGKAKAKSKCDEKDLSAAYMEAQIKKLPLLFLYTTELTKKAQEMLETGAFENAIVKKVE